MVNEVNCAQKALCWPMVSSWDDFSEQLPTNQVIAEQLPTKWVIALMQSSKRAAALRVSDGTNSDGWWESSWIAARQYPMMDNHVNELLVLL
jgi:hypothetical protein